MTPDKYQAMALKTWYAVDNPLHLDPRHPLIKLAGEAGEILDLYGKHEYKPGFSWWDCKLCGVSQEQLENLKNWKGGDIVQCCHTGPVPKVLDELGDYFYYLRIVAHQQNCTFEQLAQGFEKYQDYYLRDGLLKNLAHMALQSSGLLVEFVEDGNFELGHLQYCTYFLLTILNLLDCTLDRLTELNYRKLNSEPTAHGWLR